jgi:hypothetical protein
MFGRTFYFLTSQRLSQSYTPSFSAYILDNPSITSFLKNISFCTTVYRSIQKERLLHSYAQYQQQSLIWRTCHIRRTWATHRITWFLWTAGVFPVRDALVVWIARIIRETFSRFTIWVAVMWRTPAL